jgi:hypothetical protein
VFAFLDIQPLSRGHAVWGTLIFFGGLGLSLSVSFCFTGGEFLFGGLSIYLAVYCLFQHMFDVMPPASAFLSFQISLQVLFKVEKEGGEGIPGGKE